MSFFPSSRPARPRIARPGRARLRAALLAALVPAALLPGPAGAQEGDAPAIPVRDQARFTVTAEPVATGVQPFTATVEEIGNGSHLIDRGGFEPIIFRTMLTAGEDAPNSILADAKTITNYDSWRDGALDGAEVEVLRVVDGELRTIRRDRIAEHGFRASDWMPELPQGRVIPADRTRYRVSLPRWSRGEAPNYFTVRAVDLFGRLSEPAAVVAAPRPDKPGRAGRQPLERKDLSEKTSWLVSAPDDLTVHETPSGLLELNWSPVTGAAGYVVYRSDQPPEAHRGYGIDLAGSGPAIEAGDMVILRKRFMEARRAELLTNRVWGSNGARHSFGNLPIDGWSDDDIPWQLVPHDADTPVTEPGETFLRARLRPGQVLELGTYNHSGTGQDFYPVLRPDIPYRAEIWLRGPASVRGEFRIHGVMSNRRAGLPQGFRLDGTWQRHVIEFTPPGTPTLSRAGLMQFRLETAGDAPVEIDVDNFRIYRADAPYLDLLPEDAEALAASGMTALRSHGLVRSGTRGYDLAQLTAPGGLSGLRGGQTLPQVLDITEAAGMDPWLQIEPHLSEEEWRGLAEYLAAPFDPATDDPEALPWAARRVAQGHPAPYTDSFDRILFEIGNETWNALFEPWTFPGMTDAATGARKSPGEVYGLYQEHVLSALASSPWWDALEPRLVPVLGGWNGRSYGIEAAAASPRSRILAHAAYIGGWDVGEGPVAPKPGDYASVLAFGPQSMARNSRGMTDRATEALGPRMEMLGMGTYESGPGYAKDGLNGRRVSDEQVAEQEKVMKSAAAGTATLDAFLVQALNGYDIQNFFTFGRGIEWKSHARWYDGGQAYPSWQWLAALNGLLPADMLRVETVEVPRRDIERTGNRSPSPDQPMVATYALRRDDQLILAVLSRRVPGIGSAGTGPGGGHTAVTIELPIGRIESLRELRMSGDYRSENTTGPQAMLEEHDLPLPADPARFEIADLPPGAARIYILDGIGD